MNKHKQGTAANAPPADQIFIYKLQCHQPKKTKQTKYTVISNKQTMYKERLLQTGDP